MVKIEGSDAPKSPRVSKPLERAAARERREQAEARDVVEISVAARLAAKLRQMPEVRAELVERVKAEIKKGTYETREKLDMAVDRLMEELFPDLL